MLAAIFGPIRFAYALYLSHWQIWIWSIPVAALRVVQVAGGERGAPAAIGMEVCVEGLRVFQFVVAAAYAKGKRLRDLTRVKEWKPQRPIALTARQVLLELVGYAIVFGGLNLLIAWGLGHEPVMAKLMEAAGSGVDREHVGIAATLTIKNLILIPVTSSRCRVFSACFRKRVICHSRGTSDPAPPLPTEWDQAQVCFFGSLSAGGSCAAGRARPQLLYCPLPRAHSEWDA